MLLHKRIPLDNLRRAELFFNTVHKLGSSESDTICNPSIHLLHSKLGFLSFITESLYRGTTLHGGEGGWRKAKVFSSEGGKTSQRPFKAKFL